MKRPRDFFSYCLKQLCIFLITRINYVKNINNCTFVALAKYSHNFRHVVNFFRSLKL